jgi:hypothetical protein
MSCYMSVFVVFVYESNLPFYNFNFLHTLLQLDLSVALCHCQWLCWLIVYFCVSCRLMLFTSSPKAALQTVVKKCSVIR